MKTQGINATSDLGKRRRRKTVPAQAQEARTCELQRKEGGFLLTQCSWNVSELGILWFEVRLAQLAVGNVAPRKH